MNEKVDGQMLQTVKSIECGEYPLESEYQFEPLDVVYSQGPCVERLSLGLILAGPMLIPSFDDGSGSGYSEVPFVFKDPREWHMGFYAYIVFNFDTQSNIICVARSLKKLPENRLTSYIFFDHGSGSLRVPLGLLEFAKKLESIKED